jgi:hypothetical protein
LHAPPSSFPQFEDFNIEHAAPLLERYRYSVRQRFSGGLGGGGGLPAEGHKPCQLVPFNALPVSDRAALTELLSAPSPTIMCSTACLMTT